jgi:hypothetical protein
LASSAEPIPAGPLREAAAGLVEAITGDTPQPGVAGAVTLADDDFAARSPSYCTGRDGVSVELGSSWFPAGQQ